MARSANRHSAKANPLVFTGQMMRLGRVRELSDKALEFLGKCVTDGVTDQGQILEPDHRITAARAIVQYSMWRENYEAEQGEMTPDAMLEEIAGSEEGLLKWMDQARPRLIARIEARIQRRALAPASFDPIEPCTSS